MREIAVVVSNDNKNVTPFETIDAIKNAGFKNVFIQWYDKEWECTQEEQLKYIRELGLNVIFAHLGYQNINSIWEEGEVGDRLTDRFINDIKVCKQNGIDMVIMHVTTKFVAPMYNEIGLNRIKKIVDYAKKLGVKVAFENLKIKGYIDYIIKNIDNDNVEYVMMQDIVMHILRMNLIGIYLKIEYLLYTYMIMRVQMINIYYLLMEI